MAKFKTRHRTRNMDVVDRPISVNVISGGLNYNVGDNLFVVDDWPLTFQVASVDGSGAVLSVSLAQLGTQVVGNGPLATTTDGDGTGCTLAIVFDFQARSVYAFPREGLDACTPSRVDARHVDNADAAVSATIANQGSDYSPGDIIQLDIGKTILYNAQWTVNTVDGIGRVESITMVPNTGADISGAYIIRPINPVATSTTGAGVGCTLNVQYRKQCVPIFAFASECCMGPDPLSFVLKDQYPPFGLPTIFNVFGSGVEFGEIPACITPHCPTNIPCPRDKTIVWNGTNWTGASFIICGWSLAVTMTFVEFPAPGDGQFQVDIVATNWATGATQTFSDHNGRLLCQWPTKVGFGRSDAGTFWVLTGSTECAFGMGIVGRCFNRVVTRDIASTGTNNDVPVYAMVIQPSLDQVNEANDDSIIPHPCPDYNGCNDPCCYQLLHADWPATIYATNTVTGQVIPLFRGCTSVPGATPGDLDPCLCDIIYESDTNIWDGTLCVSSPITTGCSTGITLLPDGDSYIMTVQCSFDNRTGACTGFPLVNCAWRFGLITCPGPSISGSCCCLDSNGVIQCQGDFCSPFQLVFGDWVVEF